MSDEVIHVAPPVVLTQEVVQPPAEQAPLPGVTTEVPRPERLRAVEAVFAREQENHLVSGLMGLWTGTLLMHDLAAEHFEDRDEIDEERENKKDTNGTDLGRNLLPAKD